MKLRLSVLTLAAAGLFAFLSLDCCGQGALKIAAVVNDDIISTRDLQNRVNLFLMTTQIPMNAQTKNMFTAGCSTMPLKKKSNFRPPKKKISKSPLRLSASVKQFEKNNKIPAGNLKKILAQNNVDMDTFESQMKADMAWVRLVRRKMYSDAQVTQKELEKAMAEAKTDLSTPKYFVSEIYIRKKDAKDLSVLVNNLRQDPRFELYAMQFSQSPTAANGGRLGWLNKGKLPEAIEKKLDKMHEGEISDPILYGEGYYIVRLDKTFDPKTDKAEMPGTEDMRKFLENQKMEEFSKKYLQDLHQKAVIELRN